MNSNIETAEGYHWKTKYVRSRISPHYLDFSNFPAPVKSYDFVNKIDFEKSASSLRADLFSLFTGENGRQSFNRCLDLKALSTALFLGSGVTRTGVSGNVPYFFRSVPSAGGLHPCHIYIYLDNIEGIETGLYYCDVVQEFFGLIQKGETDRSTDAIPMMSLCITGEFFKSAWKYRERAFRYLLLDAGHLAENIFLAFKAAGHVLQIEYDFDDGEVSDFLSIDNQVEIPLVCLNTKGSSETAEGLSRRRFSLYGPKAVEQESLSIPTHYPLLKKAYRLGVSGRAEGAHSSAGVIRHRAWGGEKQIPLPRFMAGSLKGDYVNAVLHRRSKRNFIPEQLKRDKALLLFTVASSLFGQAGGLTPASQNWLHLGFSCRNIQAVADGFYVLSRKGDSLLLVKPGQFQKELSGVCLDQKWIANANMNFLFVADLPELENRFGARGYRHVLMDAGRTGQRIYLAAAAWGMGCCAVGALYDEEAQDILGLEKELALVYVVSAGSVKN